MRIETFIHDAAPTYPIIHATILKESWPIMYMLKEVKAPRKEEIAIPTISNVVISVFVLDFESLNIIRDTTTEVTNPNIPYITSGKLSIYAITAPKVALADIPII